MTDTTTSTDTSSEDVSGLKNKNADLIRDNKALKLRAENAEAEALAAKDAADTAAGNELAKLQRKYENLEKSLKDMTAERDTFASELKTTRVDHAISAAIASGNVRPEMVEAAEAIMYRRVDYTDSEATIDGKTIADFAKSFFAKDGAHYVRAPDNAGADAHGNNGSKAVNTFGFTKETYNHGAYARVYIDEGVEAANSIADAVGRPDLKSAS